MATAVSFRQQLDDYIAMQVSRLPAEVIKDLTSPIEILVETNAAAKALQEGQKVPDFTLPDAYGQEYTLSELLKKGPVVITFYRGIWCNFCSLEMNAYQSSLDRLQELGASLIAISPQTQEHCLAISKKLGLTFAVLSDQGNRVSHQFGLVFTIGEPARSAHYTVHKVLPKYNGDDSWEVPIPATYVIDQSGTIRLAFIDPDFMNRLDPEVVIEQLQSLQMARS
jgi:peroxiredoxin